MSPPLTTPRVAIVGAGPAGLLLANILSRHNVDFTVFELNATPRTQGGTLDLHPEFGQAALREAGLWDDFTTHAHPEADVSKLVDRHGVVWIDENTVHRRQIDKSQAFDRRPEIDRADLLKVLLGRLPGDRIAWGHKLERVVPEDTGSSSSLSSSSSSSPLYTLEFADGSRETGFGMVVGADGAWSRVRNLLTDVKPSYSGISGVSFRLDDPATRNPWMHGYIGAGSCFSFSNDRTVQAQRQGSGAIMTYAFVRVPEDFVTHQAAEQYDIHWEQGHAAKKRFIDTFYSDYAPDLVRVLRESTDVADPPRALYHFPIGFKWERKTAGAEAVTLLGDAAHVMTPFAGVGVNAALADAMDLGKRIVANLAKDNNSESEANKTLAGVVADYEQSMFPRGEAFAKRTMKGLVNHFSDSGCEERAARIRASWAQDDARKAQKAKEEEKDESKDLDVKASEEAAIGRAVDIPMA